MLRTIPDMVVCAPSDPFEARALTTLSSTYEGPMYIQLGKAGEKLIHENELYINVGDILPYKVNNKKEAIIVNGSIAYSVVNSENADNKDIYTLPFVKPINSEQITKIAKCYDTITVIEEQQLSGGVGSAVIEKISDLFYEGKITAYPKIQRIGIGDYFQDVSGSQMFLRERAGLL